MRAAQAVEVVRLKRQLYVAQEQSAALRAELGQCSVRLVTAQIETKEIDATLAERTAQVERLASRFRISKHF